jgi:hypothetical protein
MVERAVGMHRDEHRRIRILRGDEPHGAVAHREIIFQIDLFEGRVLAYKFGRKGAGLSLPGDLRCSIARGPTIVMA